MEYTLYYAKGSEVSHAASYKDHIRIGKGQISIRQIRDLSKMREVVMFVVVTAMRSYQSIILRYRSAELSAFKKKYTDEWRQPFLEAPAVTYTSPSFGPSWL